ncbi:MAG TPA: glycosyltransferase family 39 protein [Polyangia bacterium]|jgi:4-amino-4-deoxy-L-arabinose transferase-like glycosyltransferase
MKVPEDTQRWLYPLVAVAVGACLFLPGIGRFGLWDPHEIKIADQARDVHKWAQEHGGAFDVTAGGKFPVKPPLATWVMTKSLGALGISETAARLPFAFMAMLGLLGVYYLGATLFTRRAGLLGALALAGAPGYILQARQLASDAFLVVPGVIAVLGLVLILWPRSGGHDARNTAVGGVLAVAGLGLGYLAGGALTGVVIPLGAVVLAAALAWTATIAPEGAAGDTLAAAGVGPSFRAGRAAVSGYGLQLAIVGSAFVIIAGLTIEHVIAATRYSPLVGAMPGKAQSGVVTWDYFLKQVGFAFFPMSALAPFAFGRLMFVKPETGGRPAFARFLVAAWGVLAFFVATLYVWRYGDVRFPALPALALGIGVLLDEVLDGAEAPNALFGFGAALVAAILARDLFLYPEYVATNHLLEAVKWPSAVAMAPVFVAFGLVFALAAFSAFALGERWRRVGRIGAHALVAVALANAALIAFVVTPQLSKHYSQKVLFDRFQSLRKAGEPLAQYRAPGRGLAYYTRGEVKDLASMTALLDYLRGEKRSFVIIPSEELGQIDKESRGASVPYYVVDDQNSRFLLISNRLGANEQDKNALKALVRQVAPTPQHPVTAEFDGTIALLGYDITSPIARGSKFTVKLHFQVKAKPPGAYKIFLHFDGPGTRFNGDHTPLDGKFPTTLWSPGDYVTDPYEMMAERATTPKGTYTMWMGFWPGGDGKRLKATAGASDGQDRVKLGTITVE